MQLKFVPILALVFGGCVFSFAAFAAENSLAIEEVIVTARKQEESSQDVPIAMTALSTELQNSTIRDLTDLNGFAPNVTIAEDGKPGVVAVLSLIFAESALRARTITLSTRQSV